MRWPRVRRSSAGDRLPIVGDHLKRPTYKILQTIGEGNAGICRIARHEVFDRDVVEKTISLLGIPDGLAREPHLLKEARHKRLIEVWEAQWEPDAAWKGLQAVTFICEYYPGGSVYDALIDGHEFGIAGALRICGEMPDALEYLHQDRGYIHRDVKPGTSFSTCRGRTPCLPTSDPPAESIRRLGRLPTMAARPCTSRRRRCPPAS